VAEFRRGYRARRQQHRNGLRADGRGRLETTGPLRNHPRKSSPNFSRAILSAKRIKEFGMKLDGFSNLLKRMRQEWDGRARKDAHFYVAFGRRSQTEEDFLASAMEVMPALQQEFVRLPPATGAERQALEIGCGPGRLMIQMAPHFGEVQGV